MGWFAGLECLHSCGVVHLDLKPANIFVTIGPDGSKRAVLIDLGFALTYPNEVKNPFVVHRGTLEFKSLEAPFCGFCLSSLKLKVCCVRLDLRYFKERHVLGTNVIYGPWLSRCTIL
jgi:Protein kinase domain